MRDSENKTPGEDRKKALKEALLKMADLCARSEQCAYDISRKLRIKGFDDGETARIIVELERRRFLDSVRFARSFANDKMRFAGWGRVKIRAALMQRRVPESDISAALEALDEETYQDRLMSSARAKARRVDINDYAERVKIMRHLVSRGYTPGEASKALSILKNEEE